MQCRVCWEPSVLSICTKCNDEAKEQARVMNRNSQQPAQEEKEMEPIERLAIAAEKYVEKCDENHPLHEAVMSANLKHLCGLMAPADPAAELRERWDKAFFAALTGLMTIAQEVDCGVDGLVHDAGLAADSCIRRHADMMDGRDRIIAEVVG